MSIFTDLTAYTHASSMDDIAFEQSSLNTPTSDRMMEHDPPKDYWFGRKYFECIIAQNILQASRLYDSVANVDSRLEREIRNFPYAKTLSELRTHGLELLWPAISTQPDSDDYRTMMFCIGAVVRKGDRRQKEALLAVLRQYGPQVAELGLIHLPAREASGGTMPSSAIRADSIPTAALDLGRYASALQEHCIRQGVVPTYEVVELSRYPPDFQANLSVAGVRYQGSAKAKKQSRHEAAKAACLALGIEA